MDTYAVNSKMLCRDTNKKAASNLSAVTCD